MFDRYRRTVEETQDLDLLPVMNLFMVLIPFLLMGAAFFHIGVIPASLPSHTPEDATDPTADDTVKLTMNLIVAPDEVSVSFSSDDLDPESLDALALKLPLADGNVDLKKLQDHLRAVKAKYPKSDTSLVLPHEELAYEQLVAILDTTREYADGLDRRGDPTYAALFPKVVFSRFIEAQPDAAQMGAIQAEAP